MIVRFSTHPDPAWYLAFPHKPGHELAGEEFTRERCAQLICDAEGCCMDDFADLDTFDVRLIGEEEARETRVRNDDGPESTLWDCYLAELERGEPVVLASTEW